MLSEWTTREELVLDCNLKPSDVDRFIRELILHGSIEADYSDRDNPRFRLLNKKKARRLLNKLEKEK